MNIVLTQMSFSVKTAGVILSNLLCNPFSISLFVKSPHDILTLFLQSLLHTRQPVLNLVQSASDSVLVIEQVADGVLQEGVALEPA